MWVFFLCFIILYISFSFSDGFVLCFCFIVECFCSIVECLILVIVLLSLLTFLFLSFWFLSFLFVIHPVNFVEFFCSAVEEMFEKIIHYCFLFFCSLIFLVVAKQLFIISLFLFCFILLKLCSITGSPLSDSLTVFHHNFVCSAWTLSYSLSFINCWLLPWLLLSGWYILAKE